MSEVGELGLDLYSIRVTPSPWPDFWSRQALTAPRYAMVPLRVRSKKFASRAVGHKTSLNCNVRASDDGVAHNLRPFPFRNVDRRYPQERTPGLPSHLIVYRPGHPAGAPVASKVICRWAQSFP